MITNIIDMREDPYRWKKVFAVIEPTYNDNSAGGDQADKTVGLNVFAIEERGKISLAEAITWATDASGEVTLYLYNMK